MAEEDAGERAIDVGQRDQHVIAPRPDVKSICLQQMLAVGAAGIVNSL